MSIDHLTKELEALGLQPNPPLRSSAVSHLTDLLNKLLELEGFQVSFEHTHDVTVFNAHLPNKAVRLEFALLGSEVWVGIGRNVLPGFADSFPSSHELAEPNLKVRVPLLMAPRLLADLAKALPNWSYPTADQFSERWGFANGWARVVLPTDDEISVRLANSGFLFWTSHASTQHQLWWLVHEVGRTPYRLITKSGRGSSCHLLINVRPDQWGKKGLPRPNQEERQRLGVTLEEFRRSCRRFKCRLAVNPEWLNQTFVELLALLAVNADDESAFKAQRIDFWKKLESLPRRRFPRIGRQAATADSGEADRAEEVDGAEEADGIEEAAEVQEAAEAEVADSENKPTHDKPMVAEPLLEQVLPPSPPSSPTAEEPAADDTHPKWLGEAAKKVTMLLDEAVKEVAMLLGLDLQSGLLLEQVNALINTTLDRVDRQEKVSPSIRGPLWVLVMALVYEPYMGPWGLNGSGVVLKEDVRLATIARLKSRPLAKIEGGVQAGRDWLLRQSGEGLPDISAAILQALKP